MPRVEVLGSDPAQANQSFHASGVGELLSHLSETNKILTCHFRRDIPSKYNAWRIPNKE